MASPNGSLDEKNLIIQSQKGDEEAYAELIRRYRRKIFFLCNHLLRDQELAEDITQETFIQAYRHLSHFKMQSRFYTWIYRIAINLCINLMRKKYSQKTGGVLSDLSYMTEAGHAYLEKMQKSSDSIENRELHEAIEKGLKTLSPIHREVLEMFDMEGLSHKDIALKLHTNPGTIRSRLHYARRQMQIFLKEYLGLNGTH